MKPRADLRVDFNLASPVFIERLVPGGAGLARLDSGEVVFVPGAMPGDWVSIGTGTRRGGACFVDGFVMHSAAPERVPSPCAYSAACGGCDLIELGGTAQRAAKLDILQQALRRTAGLELPQGAIEWISSPAPLAYRERIRLQVACGQLGFFGRNSHELVTVSRCEVALPILNDALCSLQQLAKVEHEVLSVLSSIEVRVCAPVRDESPTLLVHLVTQSAQRSSGSRNKRAATFAGKPVSAAPRANLESFKERIASALKKSCAGYTVQVRVDREASEPAKAALSGQNFSYFRPGSFSQVNPALNRTMIEIVTTTAQNHAARNFLDLYCGSGNFTIPLLALGLRGTGIEVDKEAIELARRATAEQTNPSWGKSTFIAATAHSLKHHHVASQRFDLVIVDPPRAGAKEVLDLVINVCSKILIMVSCDPVTLARDLRVLLAADFRLQSLRALDMFPQTHHLETIAILSKTER